MAYATLKAAIQAVIKQNGNNEITGDLLQQALLSMIDSLGAEFQFGGGAEPADVGPGTPDYKVAYLAGTPGTYSNFGGFVVNGGEVAVLKWAGSWSKEVIAEFLTKDEFDELVSFVKTYCAAQEKTELAPTIETGTVFYSDGTIEQSGTYDLYKFPVTPGMDYEIDWSRGRYYNQYVVAWYDGNGAYISKEEFRGSLDVSITQTDRITAPVGASFAYVNVQTGRASMYHFSLLSYVKTDDIYNKLKETIEKTTIPILSESAVTLEWQVGKYVKDDNTLGNITTPDYRACKDVFVGNAEKIRWFLFYGGTARVVTTDANHEILNVYTEMAIEIDNSSHEIQYISLSNNFDQLDDPKLYISTFVPINEQVMKLSTPAGKSLAVLGDSIMMLMSEGGITGNTVTYVGTNDVTYDLADLTNIGGLLYVTSTLVDGEIAPTTIRADVHNSKQANMDAESWLPLRDALGASSVINTGRGGATITGNVITTAYPAHGEPTFNTIPNHCLELKRRVDAGQETPAFIFIWAGTNDVVKFVSGSSWIEPTNFDEIMSLDYETQLLANTNEAMAYKQTFYGGLRFSIEFLSRNFPNAQIVLFGPIQSVVGERNFERIQKVGGYIKKMADRYSLVFVDACVEIGISDVFDTAQIHRYLYDGLHPNESGKALYCAYAAKKIMDICVK